jgi:uncharacterized membrane protein
MSEDVSARGGPGALDILSVVTVLGLAGLTGWVALNAPEGQYPVHIGLSGRPDRWEDKTGFLVMLSFLTVVTGLIAALMSWLTRDTRLGEQARRAGPLFPLGRVIGLVGPAGAAVLMVAVGLGKLNDPADAGLITRVVMAFLALVMLATGDQMGRTKPNAVAGVRTYFTLTSRLAWDKSNRLVGRLFFWSGLIGLLAAPFAPQPWAAGALIAALLVSTAWGLIEGWRVWRVDPERREAV